MTRHVHGFGFCAGRAFRCRRCGGRRENIELSARLLKRSLEFCSRSVHPDMFAGVLNMLGLSYNQRMAGDCSDNKEVSSSR